jgi:MiaB/RimO family radical SAM methylthiotransferase
LARGKLRSYSVEEIVKRVKHDVEEGIREFWFTSQDTASYGFDIGANLCKLINKASCVPGDFLIRIGMMTPSSLIKIADQLVDAFQSRKVFKFIHIPIQSGDNDVLRLMNRPYTCRDFVQLVNCFRKDFPRLTLATDVIVGFPTETEIAFKNTCSLIKEVKPDVVNISKFFARPMTSALNLEKKVPPPEIKRRSTHLTSLVRNITLKRNSLWKNWRGRILIDEIGKANSVVGRNSSYKPIAIKSQNRLELLGQFIYVRVKRALHSCLLGEII